MTVILYAIIALFFFLPFQFALNPVNDFDIAIIRIFILLITLFYFAYALWKRTFLVPRGWIIGFLAAFIMWTLFSLFFSPVPSWTIRKILFFLTITPFIIPLIAVFVYIPQAKERILNTLIFGTFIISIIGIIQFILQFIIPLNKLLYTWSLFTPFFLGESFSESVIMHNSWLVNIGSHDFMRAIAFFPDPHIFSFYLGLIAPFSLSNYFTTQKKIWILSFIIIITADLLTFSRGGYVGIIGGTMIGVILLWQQVNTRLRHFIILSIISFLILILIPQNPITKRLLSSFDSTDDSNTHRIELWTQAIEEIKTRPLLGTGLGAYPYVINPTATYRMPIYVHNLALDVFVELGIIGFVLFGAIFIATITILYKNRNQYMALFAIISLTVFLFHSLFDTPIFSVHIFPLLLFIFSLGIFYENKNNNF